MKFNRRRGTKRWMTDPDNPWIWVLFWLIVGAGVVRLILEIASALRFSQ